MNPHNCEPKGTRTKPTPSSQGQVLRSCCSAGSSAFFSNRSSESFLIGWGSRIRTYPRGFRVRCPTTRLFPSVPRYYIIGLFHEQFLTPANEPKPFDMPRLTDYAGLIHPISEKGTIVWKNWPLSRKPLVSILTTRHYYGRR